MRQATSPSVAEDGESVSPFAISAEERNELRTALMFATGTRSMRALGRRPSAWYVAVAFETLTARIAANDRLGALRAIGLARSALRRCRERSASGGATAVELEAMSLALDHAERLALEAPPDERVS
jgi:hypothetical protein